MLEAIFTGMSGLLGFSSGLRSISNNTANMNTPGYKGARMQFSDLFYSAGNLDGGMGSGAQTGFGVSASNRSINFRQGELRSSADALDLAIDGAGMFVLRNADDHFYYTRAGQFQFNSDGLLVNRIDGARVMGLDDNGGLTDISLAGLRTNPAKATATVRFNGNLSSTAATQHASATVIDAAGASHALTLQFTRAAAGPGAVTSWELSILDGPATVGSGVLVFTDGVIDSATARLSFSYAPPGVMANDVTFDFSSDVTSFAAGNVTNLVMSGQDGRSAGGLTTSSFDAAGLLNLNYSNGQTVRGTALALAQFDTPDAVRAVGGNRFDAIDPTLWRLGRANQTVFGAVKAATLEASNIDLSQEFSELVIMQRGYQSSSQVISTANEMLQELFTMRGK